MPGYRYIYDQFREIVNQVSTVSGKTCYYQFGHYFEVIQTLRAITQDPTKPDQKYPLIALFTDYEEEQGRTPGIESEVSLHLIIATLTDKDYSAQERAEINFKPTLEPIYDALKQCVLSSGYYQNRDFRCRKINRFYWGKNGLNDETGNVFEDMIDAIEIKNLQLSIIQTQNC